MNSFYRADIGACATVCAQFGIDYIDISFADRFNGALIDAATTSSAFVSYNISHFSIILSKKLGQK
jgi:hypothetical protein